MKNNVSIESLIAPLKAMLSKTHVTIFFVVIVAGLAYAVFILNQSLILSSGSETPSAAANTNFDEETIRRIEQLRTNTDEPANTSLPNGRINPFVE